MDPPDDLAAQLDELGIEEDNLSQIIAEQEQEIAEQERRLAARRASLGIEDYGLEESIAASEARLGLGTAAEQRAQKAVDRRAYLQEEIDKLKFKRNERLKEEHHGRHYVSPFELLQRAYDRVFFDGHDFAEATRLAGVQPTFSDEMLDAMKAEGMTDGDIIRVEGFLRRQGLTPRQWHLFKQRR